MPNLDKVVTLINNQLKTSKNLSTRLFQNSKWYNIADKNKTTGDVEITQPLILDNNGEGISVVFDDTNFLQVFHKVDTINYLIADVDYGNPGTTMQEEAEMSIIVVGSRKRLKTRQENIMAAISLSFIKEFKDSDIRPLGMNSCIIEMGSVDIDPYSVWDQNWIGAEYSLNTDTFLFSMKYKIVSTFNKNCFTIC